MKRLLRIIRTNLIAGFILLCVSVNAQSTSYPWAVGVSWHWMDFWAVELPFRDVLTQSHWVGEIYPTKFSVSRSLISSLNVEAHFAFMKYENSEIRIGGNPNKPTEIIHLNKDFVWYTNFELHYEFANGYMLSKTSFFTPYLLGSLGATGIDQVSYFTAGYGLGLEFWPYKLIGINFTAAYRYVPDFGHDYFNYSLGLKVRFGKAKDTDKDGIPDKDDACPYVWGIEKFNGCPDTDGDGLVDSLDNCPLDPGPIELNGCPDRDKDGIPDKDDRCPDQPGPKELNGCPDRDKDGVADIDDRCPDQPGPKELAGCPDRDNDGVPDIDDECPDQPGVIALKGCPDSDGDGIPDKDDKCPNEKGPKENNGCPIVEKITVVDTVKVKQIEKTLGTFADLIEFEFGKYIIKPVSYPKLDSIVSIMREYPNSKFRIEGHTDNVGSDAANQILSENRAYAVREYFINKGIDPSRLTAVGYGESRPRDTNATPEGRARNRRVEIHLVQ